MAQDEAADTGLGRPARAQRSGALNGAVRPAGDKSVSHRALIFNALAEGEASVTGLLEGEDVLATAAALSQLGAGVEREAPGAWRIRGVGAGGFRSPDAPLDMGNSGTAARLMLGALAGHPVTATLIGDESLSRRPMARVLKPLRVMGARFDAENDRLPVTVRGVRPVSSLHWDSPVASAQVKSAILLAALAGKGETEITEPRLSRDHTERMLPAFGASVHSDRLRDGGARHTLMGPVTLTACDVAVPADPSSAAFLAAAALLCPGSAITLKDVMANPTRDGFFRCVEAMGGAFERTERENAGETTAHITVRAQTLTAADPDPAEAASFIDEVPILAVLAAYAEGDTQFRGLGELRVKESDRITTTVALLRANGVHAEETGADSFLVRGCGPDGVPGGGRVQAQGDHRIAMSALILGLAAQEPVEVADAATIATSYPTFFSDLIRLGAEIEAPEGFAVAQTKAP